MSDCSEFQVRYGEFPVRSTGKYSIGGLGSNSTEAEKHFPDIVYIL